MKLIAACIFLAISAMHCLQLAAGATVGLYGPDRYEGIPDMCLMPMDFGYCRAKVKRFYFDMRRMKCATFYFGGCAGNINNFKTLEECNKVCLDSYDESSHHHNDEVVNYNYNSRSSSGGSSSSSSKINNTISSSSSSSNTNAPYKSYAKFSNNNSKIQNRSDDNANDDYDEEN